MYTTKVLFILLLLVMQSKQDTAKLILRSCSETLIEMLVYFAITFVHKKKKKKERKKN